ncbi:T9SS type A sorting domain-containing protein [Lacinutrix sp. MedPE-SW]|uniref:T9SS type A sorting domain-containing protein n=1 Tax=Lacinutrix sp. MedPE-SW TaxID=1860087 RepID=UPI0009248454|nr:T9SS type A sorting domain-containing protein [Lacinutrix sp. MedPE-SW]OIQ24130.1 MAG: hypothetical protein BM549_02145 [Lacinutrix sp. MedPE-SW]
MKKITFLTILLTMFLGYSQQQVYTLGFEPSDPDGDINAWTTFDPPAPSFEIIDNPMPNGVNTSATTKVLKLNMVGAAPCYAGATNFNGTLGSWELDATVSSNLTLSMDVNRSSTNGVVGVKFANATNGTVFEITDAQGQVSAANTWETLTWDISGGAISAENLNIEQIAIFIDFTCGGADTAEDVELLVDNITWGANKISEATEPFNGVINVDANAAWGGFMNVFETPTNGGAYVFGSGWGVLDLKTVLDTGANTITLQPNFNTYLDNPLDPFWVDQTTLLGNKEMEASTVIQDNSLVGESFTFTGNVASNTLSPMYNEYAFIRIFDAGFGLLEEITSPLSVGTDFSVSYNNTQPAAANIQYGFTVRGVNANPSNETALGSVVIQPSVLSLETFNANNFTVFPNPTLNNWTVTATKPITNIKLYNVLGKQVSIVTANAKTVRINANNLQTGLYFAKITTSLGTKTVKLIRK